MGKGVYIIFGCMQHYNICIDWLTFLRTSGCNNITSSWRPVTKHLMVRGVSSNIHIFHVHITKPNSPVFQIPPQMTRMENKTLAALLWHPNAARIPKSPRTHASHVTLIKKKSPMKYSVWRTSPVALETGRHPHFGGGAFRIELIYNSLWCSLS